MQNDNKKTRKVKSGTIIGVGFSILAIIGLITVIVSGYGFTKKILDNEGQKAKFEKILLPILMLDPVPFDNPKTLDELTILRASLWTAIGEKREKYSYDDMGNMIVPKSDVDFYAARLFGKDIEVNHQSFSEGLLIRYVYDEEHLLYRVPMDAQTGYYIPKVIKVIKKGDKFLLTVGYVPTGNGWAISVKGQKLEPTVDKYMIYELKKVDNNYQLVAIKNDKSQEIRQEVTQDGLQEQDKNDKSKRVIENEDNEGTKTINNG